MRSRLTVLIALVGVTLFGAAPALAADPEPVSGKGIFTLGTGRAGKALTKQKVISAAVSPATLKRLPRKRAQITLKPYAVRVTPGQVGLKGGLALRRKQRRIAFRGLKVTVARKATFVTGKFAGKQIRIFRSETHLQTGQAWRELQRHAVAAMYARLSLTRAATRVLRKRLRLKRLRAGPFGRLALNADRLDEPARPPEDEPADPWFAQCGIETTATRTGNFPAAPPLPELPGSTPILAGDPETGEGGSPIFDWGLKESLRSYLGMFDGSMHALDGAELRGGDGKRTIAATTFGFPISGGEYGADTGRAYVNVSGTGVFCNKAHGFRITVSNPTVVIDGDDSRIDADLDFNKYGTRTGWQRTTIMKLDPTGITPGTSPDGTEVTWTDIPGELTDASASLFCAEGGPPGTPEICIYSGPSDPAGATEVDPVTITINTSPSE